LIAIAPLFPLAASAQSPDVPTAAICGKRPTCAIAGTHAAGKSPAGADLRVIEVRLGLADKPDDAPDDGCRTGDDKRDGGVEYWLLDGSTAPRRLLALCNDGYGSAGVGEDEITIEPNRLVHGQSGGSAWRWTTTSTYTLAPWRLVAERDCSYHNAEEATGTETEIDYVTLRARSVAKDRDSKEGIGCPDVPPGVYANFKPAPAPGLLAAGNIVQPNLGTAPANMIPRGTAIGNCVPPMTTAGADGFIVHGTAASTDKAAEIGVVAESYNRLLIQVRDPLAGSQPAPAGGSWIHRPHLEVWVGLNRENLYVRLPLDQVTQIGVDLDGKTYQGAGRKGPLPSVERWSVRDATGRPAVVLRLTWPDEYALLGGVAVVYSQAEGGRQTRLVATTGIVNNRPLYVPTIVPLAEGACRVRDGRLLRVN
jgi:hypothetical protein